MANALLSIYTEILKGYSELVQCRPHAYFKHPGPHDIAILEEQRGEIEERISHSGLPTEQDQLDYLAKEGLWTNKNEQEILDANMMLRGLKDNRDKVVLRSQVAVIKEEIKKAESKLEELKEKRRNLIGITVETICQKQANEFFVWFTLYSNNSLTEHYLSKETFDELTDIELAKIIINQNKIVEQFNTTNLQKIALLPFFTNFFYLSNDDPYSFYGKPIIQLSNYQAELFGLGRYFKSLLSETDAKIPEELIDKPDELIEWVTTTKNTKKLIDKADKNMAVGIVGAKKSDLEGLNANVIDFAAEAKKRGGKLSKTDLMELHGM